MQHLTYEKSTLLFLFSCILFYSCLPSFETASYEGGLEMWEEPRHQLVFSKDNIKVMDVVIPGGDTCLFHIHRHPTVYVLLNGAKYATQNWGKEWENVPIMDIAWDGLVQDMSEPYTTLDPPLKHRVAVPDDETYHLIGILNAGKGVTNVENASRPLNNAWFRETRYEVPANQTSESLQFEHPAILVQYTNGLTSIQQNGIEHSFKTEKGGYSYHEANQPFTIVNKASMEQKFVVMEVK